MTQPLFAPTSSARRPSNIWFWVALVALVILVAVAFFALTRRPPHQAQAPAPTATAPAVKPTSVPSAPLATPKPPGGGGSPARPMAPQTVRTVAPTPPPLPIQTPVAAPAPAPAPIAAPPLATPKPANQGAAMAARAALDEARAMQAADNLGGARAKLVELLAGTPDAALRAEAEELLGAVHTTLVFSPRPMAEKTDYTVQIGDSLDKIARKFGTSVDLVRKSNLLAGPMIRANQRLRVFSGTFRAAVDKSDNILTLSLNDHFFKRYRVGTGQYNKTPVGTFKITDKIAQPTWWRPDGKSIPYGDPENLLGTHWLALDVPGYGIHGTWDPTSVGHQSSAGCIRLTNNDVEELFALLPLGTQVIIED